MGYTLTSEATDEPVKLSTGEWERLLVLAATHPSDWHPQEDRDYTRGRIDSEEASEMADSIKGMLGQASSESAYTPSGQSSGTIQELREKLGYEEDPLRFFGNPQRRYQAERFVRLAFAGAFEIIPDSEL